MPFDHNDHYHRLLLGHVPRGCRTALDVGCGTGRFARRLAESGTEVDAVDPSAEVIEAALSASRTERHEPCFRHADVTQTELPRDHYDFISCLASIHHMPFGTLTALRDALAPGGTLVVLGCYRERSPLDFAWSLAAVPVNAVARVAVAVRERARPGPGVRAPVKHPEMPLAQVRQEAAALLPGTVVRRLLFWRYLLVFRK
ncbi:MAG TPA: class I SAM-dependent methyltransferase [Streptomyces sp.]|nr:class I SAM-dependent methyltransferase [Streptomyces sp.]